MRAPHRLTLLFVVCLGFGGIAAGAASIAKILFVVFIVLFLLSLISGRRPSGI